MEPTSNWIPRWHVSQSSCLISFPRALRSFFPPKSVSDGSDYPWLPQTWQPTITACNMYTETRNVTIDPSSRNITSDSIPDRTPQTTWKEWQAPARTYDTLISSVSLIRNGARFVATSGSNFLTALYMQWASIGNVHSTSAVQATTCNVPWFSYPGPANETCQYSDFLTVTERSVL